MTPTNRTTPREWMIEQGFDMHSSKRYPVATILNTIEAYIGQHEIERAALAGADSLEPEGQPWWCASCGGYTAQSPKDHEATYGCVADPAPVAAPSPQFAESSLASSANAPTSSRQGVGVQDSVAAVESAGLPPVCAKFVPPGLANWSHICGECGHPWKEHPCEHDKMGVTACPRCGRTREEIVAAEKSGRAEPTLPATPAPCSICRTGEGDHDICHEAAARHKAKVEPEAALPRTQAAAEPMSAREFAKAWLAEREMGDRNIQWHSPKGGIRVSAMVPLSEVIEQASEAYAQAAISAKEGRIKELDIELRKAVETGANARIAVLEKLVHTSEGRIKTQSIHIEVLTESRGKYILALAEAERERQELREALQKFGRCSQKCASWISPEKMMAGASPKCDCGFERALASGTQTDRAEKGEGKNGR